VIACRMRSRASRGSAQLSGRTARRVSRRFRLGTVPSVPPHRRRRACRMGRIRRGFIGVRRRRRTPVERGLGVSVPGRARGTARSTAPFDRCRDASLASAGRWAHRTVSYRNLPRPERTHAPPAVASALALKCRSRRSHPAIPCVQARTRSGTLCAARLASLDGILRSDCYCERPRLPRYPRRSGRARGSPPWIS
jgi:hypothetical protein